MRSFPEDVSMALRVLFSSCVEWSFGSEKRFFCTLLWYLLLFWHNNNILTFQGKYEVSVEIKNKEINSLKEELKSLQVLSSLFCSLSLFLFSVSGLEGDTPFRPDTTQVIYHCPHAWLLFNNLAALHRHTRGHFWYSIWETATAVFGYFKAQWCSFKGHAPMDPFNLIFFHISGSWDGSDLIVMMIC